MNPHLVESMQQAAQRIHSLGAHKVQAVIINGHDMPVPVAYLNGNPGVSGTERLGAGTRQQYAESYARTARMVCISCQATAYLVVYWNPGADPVRI